METTVIMDIIMVTVQKKGKNHGTKDVYYTFQYVLAPTLSMYEALGDVSYLERALNWGSTMVDKAVISDRDGFRNWSGDWDSPYADKPIYYMLWDLQGSTELARMARIVLTDESLAERYGAQAEKRRYSKNETLRFRWRLQIRDCNEWIIYSGSYKKRIYLFTRNSGNNSTGFKFHLSGFYWYKNR